MRPPIGEVGPTVVFNAAFEGDQSVDPAFDQRRLSLLILEKWDRTPSQAAAAHTFVGRTETSLGFIARAGRAIECKSRRKTDCAVNDQKQIACEKRSKPTSCRAMYLCCDGPIIRGRSGRGSQMTNSL